MRKVTIASNLWPFGCPNGVTWDGGYRWTRTTDLSIMSAAL